MARVAPAGACLKMAVFHAIMSVFLSHYLLTLIFIHTALWRQHVEIAISVARTAGQLYPGGLPAADLRSPDEPLLGTAGPGPAPPPGRAT